MVLSLGSCRTTSESHLWRESSEPSGTRMGASSSTAPSASDGPSTSGPSSAKYVRSPSRRLGADGLHASKRLAWIDFPIDLTRFSVVTRIHVSLRTKRPAKCCSVGLHGLWVGL